MCDNCKCDEVKGKLRGFEVVIDEGRHFKDQEITLPTRGSISSAGYDFYSNETVTISPNELYMIMTDVKAYMQEDEYLALHIRSSVGIKKGLMLANSTGVIDSDYYQNEKNDGNISVPLVNMTRVNQTIKKGERIAQGIFNNYLKVDNDNVDIKRNGGTGSTGV